MYVLYMNHRQWSLFSWMELQSETVPSLSLYTLLISLIYAVFRLWRRTHAFKFYSEMYKGLKQEKKSKKI